MSDDSEQEDYEPWSDDDDDERQQAPARPAAPEALDAETLTALNSLDGETLAGQLWGMSSAGSRSTARAATRQLKRSRLGPAPR